MRLYEFANDDNSTGYYDPAEDKLGTRHASDVRKPKLMLSDLNRLKRMRALQKLEKLKHEDLLGLMYSPAEEPNGPPGF